MTDRYENIRGALAMGPTPGPWVQDGDGVSAYDEDVAVAVCCPSDAETAFIAACDPDTIRALLAERDAMKEALEMIAGVRPCVDMLMGNADIARAALAQEGGQ